jgi:hypothetical protein
MASTNDVTIPNFSDLIGVEVTNGNTLTKTNSTVSWSNGGSYSTSSISGDGFVCHFFRRSKHLW